MDIVQIYLPIAGNSVSLILLLGLGGLVGLLSGLFGVGGGFLLTPLLIMIGIPFFYNISDGLAVGFVVYPILKVLTGKGRQVSATNWYGSSSKQTTGRRGSKSSAYKSNKSSMRQTNSVSILGIHHFFFIQGLRRFF